MMRKGKLLRLFLCLLGTSAVALHPAWSADEKEAQDKEAEQTTGEQKEIPKHKPASPISLGLEDPRGKPELTLCSQNLNNLGDYVLTKQRLGNAITLDTFNDKLAALVIRFTKGNCDVIAVQELLGLNEESATKNLAQLGQLLRFKTGRIFEAIVGQTNDPISRVGFLVATDRAEILAQLSYNRVELPKILPKERPRFFLRGPLEVQLSVKGRDGSASKVVTVVNFHLKSKGGKERDPAELEWETYRMQMAEAIRRIIESRHERSFGSGETILALVGDRNSNFDAASNEILSGSLTLNDFKADGGCRLSSRGVAFCKKDQHRALRLFSVMQGDPQTKLLPGTFHYKSIYSWLDDIQVPQESLRFAWTDAGREGDYTSFVISDPKDASDHSLVGVTFNW